ncbi:MAG: NAD-dependent epimerase/dehydratase family protein [bacterium]|nr:NAD-dependent epimerase/dehydratase family protein [bacterium]
MSINYKDKQCFVTGGSGFIGQHLVKRLLDEGASVTVLDNFSFGGTHEIVDPRASIIEGDVRNSTSFIAPNTGNYDYIFHFGAPSSIVAFKEQHEKCRDITVNGFINALNFAKNQKARLVYPSSGSIYSGANRPHCESAEIQYDKLNNYAKAKIELEKIQKENANVNSVGLRILAGYGPGEWHKGEHSSVPYLLAKAITKGEAPIIFGDGNQIRDFVFIEDIINAILMLGEKAVEPVVNVGTGTAYSFNKVVETINEILGTNIKATYIPRPNLYLEVTTADTTIFSKYYATQTSLKDGLTKTIESIKEILAK